MTLLEKIAAATTLIEQAINTHHKLAIASSFGKDSVVLIHLAQRVQPDIPIFSLLADTEFQATDDYVTQLIHDWQLNCKLYHYQQKSLIQSHPELCCQTEKVRAMKQAVTDLDCILSGVRRSEGESRTHMKPIENQQGLIKVNPILWFSELDVWRYIAVHQIPVNPLYQLGYRSLGCEFCSQPEQSENDQERAGRWHDTDNQGLECGIHTERLKKDTPDQ